MFNQIVQKLNEMNVYEKRENDDDYYEVVFLTEDTNKWEKVIADVLGPAAKPAKAKPTKEDVNITQKFGGIQTNQTLFRKDEEGATIIAMFWPWQDNAHTTLKTALVK